MTRSTTRGQESAAAAVTKGCAESSWSPRESELLSVTLRLLQQYGCDRLTVDAVVSAARASKATLYRRWPSKAELVLAAVTEGARQDAVLPETGTLREDLRQLGQLVCEQVGRHASTIRAVLVAGSHRPALNDVMQHQLIDHWEVLTHSIFQQAVSRGEIEKTVISRELWDLLPGYLIFRSILAGRPPTQRTVHALIDDVIIPSMSAANPTSAS